MGTQNLINKSNYLTFKLNQEYFAIDAGNVIEILELSTFTIVPNSSEYIKGILNFRGEIVPIINMHKRFKMNDSNNSAKMIIVINSHSDNSKVLLGLLVDDIRDVIEFELKDIRNVPNSGFSFNVEFLSGMVELNGIFFMMLNIDKVLNIKELSELTA